MIRKPTLILALFLGLLVCSIEGQFKCVNSGMIPFGGGVVQPLVSTPQNYYTEPETTRQQLIIEERLHGTRDAPASGIGLMQKWEF